MNDLERQLEPKAEQFANNYKVMQKYPILHLAIWENWWFGLFYHSLNWLDNS
jgi:hypothetical protein